MKSKITFFIYLLGLLSLTASAQNMNVGYIQTNEDEYSRLPKAPSLGFAPEQTGLSSYDLSAYMPPVGNQGTLNTSAAYSACYSIKSFQEMLEENASSYLLEDRIDGSRVFSPAFLQNTLTQGNPEKAVSLVEILNGIKNIGCVKWNDFPTYWEQNQEWNYNASLPSASLQQRAAKYKIKDWYSLGTHHNIAVSEVKDYLRYNYPVLLGLNIDEGFVRLNASYPVWDHNIGTVQGNHTMVIVGFDDNLEVNQIERGAFKVLNSWGAEWGAGGYCWISYNHFRNAALEAYVMEDEVNRDYIQTQNPQNTANVNVYETYYNNQLVLYPIYVHVDYIYLNHYPSFYQSYSPVFQNNYYGGYCQNAYYNGNGGNYYQYNNYGGNYCYYNNVVVVNNTTIVNNNTTNNNGNGHSTFTHNSQVNGGDGSGFIKNTNLAPQHPVVVQGGIASTNVSSGNVGEVAPNLASTPPTKPRSIAEISSGGVTSPKNTPKTIGTSSFGSTQTNVALDKPRNPANASAPVTPRTPGVPSAPQNNVGFSAPLKGSATTTPKPANVAVPPRNIESPKTNSFSTSPKVETKTTTTYSAPKPQNVEKPKSYSTHAPSQSTYQKREESYKPIEAPKKSYSEPRRENTYSKPVEAPQKSYSEPKRETPKSSEPKKQEPHNNNKSSGSSSGTFKKG